MKVLMVVSQFYPIVGGAERQAQLLAEALAQRGIEVTVVTGWWRVGSARREKMNNVTVFRNFTFWGMLGIRGLRPLGVLAYMISLAWFLIVHKRHYDLIHVHQALYPAFISILIGRQLLKKPVIVKTASSGVTSDINQLKRYPLGYFQLRYLLRAMDVLVANCIEGGKEFHLVGYPKSRITYIPNGVRIPSETKQDYIRMKRVVTVSRLSEEKGIDVLLRAWACVELREEGLELLIYGCGPVESELKRLAKELGIEERVKFMGLSLNVSEIMVKEADVFVLPSRAEGLSNALLEAMSCGLPCIATTVGGNHELIGHGDRKKIDPGSFVCGERGILVHPDDAIGLARAIKYLGENPLERERLGLEARRGVERDYSIDVIADRYLKLYDWIKRRAVSCVGSVAG